MPCFLSASKLAPLKQIWTFWTSMLRDFRLTLPWRTSQSGGSLMEKICSDPRNCHIENFLTSYLIALSLFSCHLSFNPDRTVQLRLQIRLDDFRKLQNARNISNQDQSEKLSFETLNFYTYATRVIYTVS